jgi:PAS domain S-box-containing protein
MCRQDITERKRAEELLARYKRELSVFHAFGNAIVKSLDLQETLANILSAALEVLQADGVAVYLLEPDGETMVLSVHHGLSEDFVRGVRRIRLGEGASGLAAAAGRPVVVDISEYPTKRLSPYLVQEGLRTIASTPLVVGTTLLGALNLAWRTPGLFPPEELDLLADVGRMIGQAVRNAKLYENLQGEIAGRIEAEKQISKALKLIVALHEIDLKIIEGANVRDTLERVCDAVVEMKYPMCWVGLAQPDKTVLPVAGRGIPMEDLPVLGIRWDDSPLGQGPSGIVVRTGRSVVCRDIQEDSRFAPWRDWFLSHGYRALISLPLTSGEGVILGVLHVSSDREDAFTEENVSALETFARQCTVAFLNSQRLEALRDAHQRLSFHVNRMPLAYIVWDNDFRVAEWNPAAERIFGWKTIEALGKVHDDLIVPWEARPHIDRVWAKLLEGDESSYSINPSIRKDGKNVTCEWFNTSLRDASGNVSGALSMVHDITEKTQLERQLRTAQRMEAVGTLAGGIAHDFNNALTGILGYGELLRARVAGDPKALADLDEISRAAERAATLTRQLLTFARRQVVEPVNLDLRDVVKDLMRFFVKVAGEQIEVKTFLAADTPTIRADRGQIEQVLMNLIVNARDAMAGGGQLLVETGGVMLEEEYIQEHQYMKKGRHALLVVSDTGIGMDEATRERAFEPFFTTKAPGKGTGLGLSVAYGIVKQQNGSIHLYSEPGKGSTIKIYFPAIVAAPDVRMPVKSEPIRGGSETILLAEDEESIRTLAERILKDIGYTVFTARNGEDAIEVFRRHREKIALAVLDVVMPKIGGREVFEVMRKENPGLKAIFMSGYSMNAIHETFVIKPDTPFLGKPFVPTVLARKVREVLDG